MYEYIVVNLENVLVVINILIFFFLFYCYVDIEFVEKSVLVL